MKIAFWSEENKAGTTFNTAVVACASVLLYPLSAAVVSGSYYDKELENSFLGNQEESWRNPSQCQWGREDMLAAEQSEYFLTRGLDCLLGKERREDLTERVLKANMHPVVRDRMYCMPCSRRENQTWWYKDCGFARMSRVLEAVEECFGLVFIDCGSRKDDLTRKLLREADVCVLNMDQQSEQIGEYYRNPPRFRGSIFFLVGNYFKNELYTRENLNRIYRVGEDALGAVPYNPQMQAAREAGRTAGGVRQCMEQGGQGQEFGRELARTTRLILKQAGAVE